MNLSGASKKQKYFYNDYLAGVKIKENLIPITHR
jgi:hypothetical protein